MERIVITGMGLVTPLGHHCDLVFQRLLSGTSAVKASPFKEAPFFCTLRNYPLPERYDRSMELAIACTRAALQDAGASFPLNDRTSLYISSTKGGMNSFSSEMAGNFMPNFMADGSSRLTALELGLSGACYNVVAACATGIFAMSSAVRAILSGECDQAVVGASESALTELVLSGFGKMGVLTKKCMSPFRLGRDGFVPGEGAAVFTLEKESNAKARNTRVYAVIAGMAAMTDKEDIVRFDTAGRSIRGAIALSLQNAGLSPEDIDAICVHGTATANNDLCEANGIKLAMGRYGKEVDCFGIKPSLGHTLGASAAIELGISILAMLSGRLPPTLGVGERDPECLINITDKAKSINIKRVMSLNFGFGGHIGVIIIEKADCL